jgi:hypothetical protein
MPSLKGGVYLSVAGPCPKPRDAIPLRMRRRGRFVWGGGKLKWRRRPEQHRIGPSIREIGRDCHAAVVLTFGLIQFLSIAVTRRKFKI